MKKRVLSCRSNACIRMTQRGRTWTVPLYYFVIITHSVIGFDGRGQSSKTVPKRTSGKSVEKTGQKQVVGWRRYASRMTVKKPTKVECATI